MIFSQNNILVVLASYNSKLKENKLKSLKFINIYSLHTYKFKSKINMKNLVNNFEKKSFFYLSYIDLKVYFCGVEYGWIIWSPDIKKAIKITQDEFDIAKKLYPKNNLKLVLGE